MYKYIYFMQPCALCQYNYKHITIYMYSLSNPVYYIYVPKA